ncbi:branched-chain amino acid transaminase [Candidatus Daviesbacteria bacterium]|nr:branched-chain amino acid transaminase [Candidatus Daviesbacteria bacterium]
MSNQKQKAEYFPYAFFQEKIVRVEDAKISIMTNALQYGTGIFAGIRGYYNENNGKPFLSVFRIEDHYTRFLNSLKIIGVSLGYNKEQLIDITLNLLKKNNPHKDTYVRPLAYAGSVNLSPNLTRDNKFDLAIYTIPLGDYLPTNKGLSAKVSSFRRISDNAIPARAKISGAYINSALARKEAADAGFDEAIFLTEDGHVAEGSAENIFIVRNGILITPPVSDEVLEGVTRRTVMEIAKEEDIPVLERSIDRSEIYIADEAFFCGTGVQVVWINNVDGRQLGNGKRGLITAKIQDKYFGIVRAGERQCTRLNLV